MTVVHLTTSFGFAGDWRSRYAVRHDVEFILPSLKLEPD